MTQLWTNSRLRVLRTCVRMHHLRYDLGIRSLPTDDTYFGDLGHRALEAYYRTWKDVCETCDGSGERPFADTADGSAPSCSACGGICESASLDDRLPAALAVADEHPDPFERIKLRLLVVAYHERWGSEDWEILAVEQEFRYQLGDHLMGGKIDVIIRNRADGRVYVVEHKFTGTATELGGAYWERLTLDSQVSIYTDGATMLGYEIAGCIYDVIKRPGHRQLLATPTERREYTKGKGCKRCGGSAGGKAGIVKGRGFYTVSMVTVEQVSCPECDGTGWKCDADGVPQAPRLHANQRSEDETEEQFEERLLDIVAGDPDGWLQRSIVVRLEDELPAMRTDVVDTIAVAELAERRGSYPRNPDACAKYGRMCELFEICAGRASADDTNRFPRGRVHPELADAT
ncbi:MAG TPA: PD-(D/E)XK nuclease family protein [Mycobacterium sp.]|nr:PD-(D/E)XK nuclease family protein [Mycobacterium sp.]